MGARRRALFAAEPAEFFLQLLDLPLGCLKAGDGLTGRRVAPLQLAALPADVEAQNLAVSLQDTVLRFLDGNGFVAALHQPVASELGPMELTGLGEAPVFGYDQSGVPVPISRIVMWFRWQMTLVNRLHSHLCLGCRNQRRSRVLALFGFLDFFVFLSHVLLYESAEWVVSTGVLVFDLVVFSQSLPVSLGGFRV